MLWSRRFLGLQQWHDVPSPGRDCHPDSYANHHRDSHADSYPNQYGDGHTYKYSIAFGWRPLRYSGRLRFRILY